MAIKVKSAAEVSRKWADVTPGRAAYYESAASVAGDDWEKGTVAAAKAFKAAISAANIEALFTGGVKRAGSAKYNRKIKDVGAARFGPGISAAVGDFESGVTPFLDEIAKITLPARAPRGSEANYARVREIGVTLNRKRLALRAAGV